jgi:bifunctional non-homologous end joining protein LigD
MLIGSKAVELKEYIAKRKFDRTPEPKPGPAKLGDGLLFVVHKHAARSLHYDLRLEMEGVLRSWAVPRGPSLDPSEKRLAVLVEDHPLEYGDFEGIIPEGSYGSGSVIIWDRGRYHHPSAQEGSGGERLLLEGFRKGDLKFVLEGEKLHGEFALVRTKKDERTWLLLKKRDQYAGAGGLLTDNRSVVSQKTLEEVLETGAAGTFEKRRTNQVRVRETLEQGDLQDAPEGPMPHDRRPMFASLGAKPFDHPDWVFEVKWDGFLKKFPPVVASLRQFGFDAVLDGEIVVVDEEGRPVFEELQHFRGTTGGHLLYYVFDLLYFAGHDLTGLPLIRRKEILKKVLPALPAIRYSEHVPKEGVLFYRATAQKGLEGIMAKHSQSTYVPGTRSRQWLKIKTRLTQEGVIAGFTEPGGSRQFFGSLVLGQYEGDQLVYIGHVGGGFSEKDLQEIRQRLEPLIRDSCPFDAEPETNAPVTWVRPELVCEVSLTGWTTDNVMRQPVFLRLREDKAAQEVVREEP